MNENLDIYFLEKTRVQPKHQKEKQPTCISKDPAKQLESLMVSYKPLDSKGLQKLRIKEMMKIFSMVRLSLVFI